MSEEFCLSEKRKVWVPSDNYAYLPEDVKEFIRLLKEDFRKIIDKKGVVESSDIKWTLDKLAGKGLVE